MELQRTSMLQQIIKKEQHKLLDARMGVISSPCADENEFASICENIETGIIFMRRAQRRLEHLERGMAFISALPHNRCLDCEEEIDRRRLEAQPDAVRCASCQEEWEDARSDVPLSLATALFSIAR